MPPSIRPSPVTASVEKRPSFLRRMLEREWRDLLMALAFGLLALGYAVGMHPARVLGELVRWWWPYEILGSFFLMVYLAFWEGLSGVLDGPRKRLILLAVLFLVLAGALHGMGRVPLGPLAFSGLLLLPGYIPVLGFSSDPERLRFLYRGGLSFCALGFTLLPTLILIGLQERPGLLASERDVIEGGMMIAWGMLYFVLRAVFATIKFRAEARQGKGADPRWGG